MTNTQMLDVVEQHLAAPRKDKVSLAFEARNIVHQMRGILAKIDERRAHLEATSFEPGDLHTDSRLIDLYSDLVDCEEQPAWKEVANLLSVGLSPFVCTRY